MVSGSEENSREITFGFSKMAPFDQEVFLNILNEYCEKFQSFYSFFFSYSTQFYFIISLSVGGPNGISADYNNSMYTKSWNNTSPSATKDFWKNRDDWIPTWHFDNDYSSLIIDSVRVWAVQYVHIFFVKKNQ